MLLILLARSMSPFTETKVRTRSIEKFSSETDGALYTIPSSRQLARFRPGFASKMEFTISFVRIRFPVANEVQIFTLQANRGTQFCNTKRHRRIRFIVSSATESTAREV